MTICTVHDPAIITGDWSSISTNTTYFSGSDYPRSAFVQSVISNLTVKDENGHTIGIDSDLKSTNLVAYLNRLTIGITNTNDLMVNYLGNVTLSSAVTWNNGGFIVDAINGITVNAITASKFVMAHTTASDLYVNGALTANGDNASVQLSGVNINVAGAILASDGLSPFMGTASIIAQGNVNFNSNTVTAAYGLIAASTISGAGSITNPNILQVSDVVNANCSITTGSVGVTLGDQVRLYSSGASLQVNADPSTTHVVMISPCDIFINTNVTAKNFIALAGKNITTNNITADGQNGVINTSSDGGFVLISAGKDITHFDINARNASAPVSNGNGGNVFIHAGNNHSADNTTTTSNATNTGFLGGLIVQHAKNKIQGNSPTASGSGASSSGSIIIQSGDNIIFLSNILASPANNSAKGGSINIQTANNFAVLGIGVNSGGTSKAGFVSLHIGHNIQVIGAINAFSSAGLGEACFIDAQNDIVILNQIVVNSSGANNYGGSAVLYSGGNIDVVNSTAINANSANYNGGTIKLCAEGFVRASGLTATGLPNNGTIKVLSAENIFTNLAVVSQLNRPFDLTAKCSDFTLTTCNDTTNQYEYKIGTGTWSDFTGTGNSETVANTDNFSPVKVRSKNAPCLVKSICPACTTNTCTPSIYDPITISGNWSSLNLNTTYNGLDFPRSPFVSDVIGKITVKDNNGVVINVDSDGRHPSLVAYENRLTIAMTNSSDLVINYMGNVTISDTTGTINLTTGGFIVDAVAGITIRPNITAQKFIMAHAITSDLYVNGTLTATGDNASIQLSGANININGAISASDGSPPNLSTVSIITKGNANFNNNTIASAYGLIAAQGISGDGNITNTNIIKVSDKINCNCSTTTLGTITTSGNLTTYVAMSSSLQVNSNPNISDVVMISPCDIFINASVTAQNFVAIAGRSITAGFNNANPITVDGQVAVNPNSDGGFVLLAAGKDITHYNINARNSSGASTGGNGGTVLVHAGNDYYANTITATSNASTAGFRGGLITHHVGGLVFHNGSATVASTSDNANGGNIVIQAGDWIELNTPNISPNNTGRGGGIILQTNKDILAEGITGNASGAGVGGYGILHSNETGVLGVAGGSTTFAAATNGLAGAIIVDTGGSFNVVRGGINLSASGTGRGGSALIYAQSNVNILNAIILTGGTTTGNAKISAGGFIDVNTVTSGTSANTKLIAAENIFSSSGSTFANTITPFNVSVNCSDFTLYTCTGAGTSDAPNQFEYKIGTNAWSDFSSNILGASENVSLTQNYTPIKVRNKTNKGLIKSFCPNCPTNSCNNSIYDPVIISGTWAALSPDTTFLGSDFPRSNFVQSIINNITVTDNNNVSIGIDSDVKHVNLVGYQNRMTIGITNTKDLVINYLGNVTINSDITWTYGGVVIDAINGITVNSNITASKFIMAHTTNADLTVNGQLAVTADNASIQLSGNNIFINSAILATDNVGSVMSTITMIAKDTINVNSRSVTANYGLVFAKNLLNTIGVSAGIMLVSDRLNCNCSTTSIFTTGSVTGSLTTFQSDTSIQINNAQVASDMVIISPCDIFINNTITAQNLLILSGGSIFRGTGGNSPTDINVSGGTASNTTSDGGFAFLGAAKDITFQGISANGFNTGNGGMLLFHCGQDAYPSYNMPNGLAGNNRTGGLTTIHSGGSWYLGDFSAMGSTNTGCTGGSAIAQTGKNFMLYSLSSQGNTYGGNIFGQAGRNIDVGLGGTFDCSATSYGGFFNIHAINNIMRMAGTTVAGTNSAAGCVLIDANNFVAMNPITANVTSGLGGSVNIYTRNNAQSLNTITVASTSGTAGKIKICADGFIRTQTLTATGTPNGSIAFTTAENIFPALLSPSFTITPFFLTGDCSGFTIQTASPYAPNQFQYKVSSSDWVSFTNSTLGASETVSLTYRSKITVRNAANPCLIQTICPDCALALSQSDDAYWKNKYSDAFYQLTDPSYMRINTGDIRFLSDVNCINNILSCVPV